MIISDNVLNPTRNRISNDFRVPLDLTDSLVALLGDGALAFAGVGFLQTRGVRATLQVKSPAMVNVALAGA